jgi:uracil-DNA glycosylase family 4
VGLFLEDKEVEAAENRPRIRQPRANQDSHPAIRGCDNCTLKSEWHKLSTPRMKIFGRKEADILVLGEAPGEDEDIEGRPFVGKSGKFLKRYLPFRDMDRLAWTNGVRCRPPGNRNPSGLELHCCSIHLEDDIAAGKYKAILGVGAVPLSRYISAGDISLSRISGIKFPVKIGEKTLWYFPIFHPSFVMRGGEEDAQEFPVFQSDIKRFFKEVDSWPTPKVYAPDPKAVNLVYHLDVAKQLLAQMRDPLGVDIEASSLRPYEYGARLLTAAFSDGETTFAFPIDHPEAKTDWGLQFLLDTCAKRPWIAHSAPMELKWLLYHGRRLHGSYEPAHFDDSMAAARIYFQRETILSLALVSRIILGVNIKAMSDIDARNIMAYPLSEVLPYNGLDAWGCQKSLVKMLPRTDKLNYNHLLGAVRSTVEMELAGLPIDLAYANELKASWGGRADALQTEARSIYEVKMFEREVQREFRLSAPQDVGIALVEYGKIDLPKTDGGKQYSTKDEIIQPYASTNPLVQLTLDYREAAKHESTYIDVIREVPELYPDGNIHPVYNVVNVSTLRHSSNSPNIQNFPKRRHRDLRKMIKARPGHVFLACDEGQLEARIYAMASKDRMLCKSIISGEDIHTYWLERVLDDYFPDYLDRLATKTNQTDEKKIRKAGRDIIKTDMVFATFFGTVPKNCSERTGIPFDAMKGLIDEFWKRYPEARAWLNNQMKTYKQTGEVRTMTGMVRRDTFPGLEAVNTPIQAAGGHIVIAAQNELSDLSRELDDFYLHPRINIHDDLTFEVPDNEALIAEYIPVIADAMTRVRYDWQVVPLNVEIKMGYDWCDLVELCTLTGDYVR